MTRVLAVLLPRLVFRGECFLRAVVSSFSISIIFIPFTFFAIAQHISIIPKFNTAFLVRQTLEVVGFAISFSYSLILMLHLTIHLDL